MTADEYIKQLGELARDTWGKLVGQQMLMREVLAYLSSEHDDPAAFLREMQEDVLNRMAILARDDDAIEAQMIELAEAEVRETIQQVTLRIGGADQR